MVKPLDPHLTSDLHSTWDTEEIKKIKKETFFCPICWVNHTMFKIREEMVCPANPKGAGGLPKQIINKLYHHFDNWEVALQYEPQAYLNRIRDWMPHIITNRNIELEYTQNKLQQSNAVKGNKIYELEQRNKQLEEQLAALQRQVQQLQANGNNNGPMRLDRRDLDFLASRISWSID